MAVWFEPSLGSRSFRLPPAAVSNTFFHLCCLFNRFLRFCLAMEIDTPAAACCASLSRCLLLKIVSSCQRQLQQQPHRCCQCASVGGRWPTKSRNTNTSNKKKKKPDHTACKWSWWSQMHFEFSTAHQRKENEHVFNSDFYCFCLLACRALIVGWA